MNVIVTGASGFLGSHICEALLQRGHKVSAIVRPTTRTDFLDSIGVPCQMALLDQPEAIAQAASGHQAIVHVAAKVHNFGHWRDFERDTIEGTRNTLDAARHAGVKRFIMVSTVGVYGWPRADGQPHAESSVYGNLYRWNYYSRSKMEAERHVREASSHKAIATTILRPTWIYGPRDSYIMPKIIDALRQGRFKWIGDGTNRLSLVHVADVAGAVVMALEHPAAAGQTYNVADDESSPTQREFIGSICRSLDISMPVSSISYQTARRIGFLGECVAHATGFRVCPPITRLSVLLLGGHRKFSNKKIKSDLGWQPSMTFDDGIGETLRWHNNNQRPS